MADELHEVASLRSENDALRARIEAYEAREVETQATNLHLRSALAAGSIVGAWSWHPARDAFVLDEGFARVFGLDATFVNVELPIDRVLVNLHPDQQAEIGVLFQSAMRLLPVEPAVRARLTLVQFIGNAAVARRRGLL